MNQFTQWMRGAVLATVGTVTLGTGTAIAADNAHTLLGVDCAAPPIWHCPDSDCPASLVTQQGATVETKTRRPFFLDCPSNYKPATRSTSFSACMAMARSETGNAIIFRRWT